jgi:hypothetical protein
MKGLRNQKLKMRQEGGGPFIKSGFGGTLAFYIFNFSFFRDII